MLRKNNKIVYECIKEGLNKGDKVEELDLNSQIEFSKGGLSLKVMNLPSSSSTTISTCEDVENFFEGKLGLV